MSSLTLDKALIRRLMNDRGVSARDIGKALGRSCLACGRILAGENHGAISLREVERLAVLLGVDAITLFDQSRSQRNVAHPDDVRVEAAFMSTDNGRLSHAELMEAFQWDGARTRRALNALAERLEGTGQRLDHTKASRYWLRGRDEPLSDNQRRRLHRALLRKRGVDGVTARMLLKIVREGALSKKHVANLRGHQHAAHASLLKQEVLQNTDGTARLHPDVVFSLGLEARPENQ